MTQNWIRLFKLLGRIRAPGGWKKFFQKPLAGGTEWATFFTALENGRSVFPVERRFDGPVTESKLCAHRSVFISSIRVRLPIFHAQT